MGKVWFIIGYTLAPTLGLLTYLLAALILVQYR